MLRVFTCSCTFCCTDFAELFGGSLWRDLGTEFDLSGDFPGGLLDDGDGIKAGKGADEHVVVRSFFAFISIKDCNGGGFGLVFCVKCHGG